MSILLANGSDRPSAPCADIELADDTVIPRDPRLIIDIERYGQRNDADTQKETALGRLMLRHAAEI